MDFEELLRQFQVTKAQQGPEEDELLSALLQKHQGDGRWKKIVHAFADLSETVRSKEWLQRRGRYLQELRNKLRESTKAKTSKTAKELKGNDAPDVLFLKIFKMLKSAVMGCQTDSFAQSFLKESKRLQMELAGICNAVENTPPQRGQIDSVLFHHYYVYVSKFYPFKKSRHWTEGFCCKSHHCKTRFIVMKTLDALGLQGDGDLVFSTLRKLLDESFARNKNAAQNQGEAEPTWKEVLPMCFDQFCPDANCMYTKPLAFLRQLVIDKLDEQRKILSCVLDHPALIWQAVAEGLSQALQVHDVKHVVGERGGTKIENDLYDAYLEWLLKNVWPTLGTADADRSFVEMWTRVT